MCSGEPSLFNELTGSCRRSSESRDTFLPLAPELRLVQCQASECPVSMQLGERIVVVRQLWCVTAEYP